MQVWDTGTYEVHKFEPKEVQVTFHGERVRGRYVLFHTRGKDWMIHRMDPPEDPERELAPEGLRPMNATLGTRPPAGDGWAWELKWDGIRALAYVDGGRIRLFTRNGNEVTHRYPELRGLGVAFGPRDAVLDGEIVALDENGRPSFELLQRRMHVESPSVIRRLARRSARGLHGVRRAVARRALVDVVAVPRPARAPARARSHRARRGRRRRTRSATARRRAR